MTRDPTVPEFPSARLQVETMFVFNDSGRIVGTREPHGSSGPSLCIVRTNTECVWAIGGHVKDDVADELASLAQEEPPATDLRAEPLHVDRYRALIGSHGEGGPAFAFPDVIEAPDGVVEVTDEGLLERHFSGWVPGELAGGRAPGLAILEDGYAVSACFCARRSDLAAEAGLETAKAFRGRGYGVRVTAAWALAVRAMGLVPLYSTGWDNTASRAVASKLGLRMYACDWSI